MRSEAFVSVLVLGTLASATVLEAHHSISMFELDSPFWIEGRFVRVERVNPHSIIVIEELSEEGATDGAPRRWAVEGPSPRQLEQMQVGDDFFDDIGLMRFCAFPMKEQFTSSSSSARPADVNSPFVSGHVLQTSDGRMRRWGSYGRFTNCLGPDFGEADWTELFDAFPLARDALCDPAIADPPGVAVGVIEEMNRQGICD